jgi:mono/diheme cytochrome c family protein
MNQQFRDEIQWKDLVTYPSKIFGYSYLYFLVVLIALGLLYLKNINNAGKNAIVPQVLKDSTAFVRDIPLQGPRVLPPVDVAKIGVTSDSLVKRGEALFKPTCSPCHGEGGLGDGPTAATLNPKPRNFHSLQGWKNGSKVSDIYKTLQEGVPGSGMAAYNYLPPADLFALIHYVRSMAVPQPVDSPEELKALDAKYSLAKGMNLPGQMPIADASVKVAKEIKPVAEMVRAAVVKAGTSTAEGASLLRQVAADPGRAIVTLMHAQSAGRSPDEFVRLVNSDPVRAGFRASVVRLTPAQWSALYQFVSTLVQEGR